MLVRLCKVPVTIYIRRIGVVRTKGTVWDTAHPGRSLIFFPALHLLRTGNHGSKRLCAAVGDAFFLCARIYRIYVLPVNARCYQHLIARPCDRRRVLNVAKRSFLAAISVAACVNIYIKFHLCIPPSL